MAVVADDIRDWGRENGWDVEEGKRLPSGLRAAYDARDGEPTTPVYDKVVEDGSGQLGLVWPDENDRVDEIPPVIKTASTASKVRSFADRVKRSGPAKPRGRKVAKPRVGVEKIITWGWKTLAQMTAPINLPVARVLDMQAPVAGMILEDTVKNTVVDKVLQPLARLGNGGETAFALIGPPLLVAALSQKPELYPTLKPLLAESLRLWIDVAGPKLEEIAEKEEKFKEKYGTRIDDMIELFFAPPPGANVDES